MRHKGCEHHWQFYGKVVFGPITADAYTCTLCGQGELLVDAPAWEKARQMLPPPETVPQEIGGGRRER